MPREPMRAVGFTRSLPIEDPDSLVDFEARIPTSGPTELLVKVVAASVNPVDSKRRLNAAAERVLEAPVILGFDAVGTVAETGKDVRLFKEGDTVWYSGSIDRQGSNAEYQVVDERIVGHKPETLTDTEAAALPLTSLTAWEAFFDRMRIAEGSGSGEALLIIGGAGGVGSVAIQLAKKLTDLTVIATASREETRDWCSKLGADLIANHYDLVASVRELDIPNVPWILNCADLSPHWDSIVELVAPEGTVASIVHANEPVDLSQLMFKSVTFAWEMMSTRPIFGTNTIIRQHDILERVAGLVDAGDVRTTQTEVLTGLSAKTLREAHTAIESGRTIGKLCIDY